MNEQELWDFLAETAFIRFRRNKFATKERSQLGELLWQGLFIPNLFEHYDVPCEFSKGQSPKWHLIPTEVWEGFMKYDSGYAAMYLCLKV